MNHYVNRVAVLGAGVMGASIAAHFAGAGFQVLLLDRVPQTLTDKEKAKGLTLEDSAVRNRLANAGKEGVLNPKNRAIYTPSFGKLIETGNFTDDLEKIGACDLILEVIVENLAIKQDFMKQIAKYRKPGTIVATNTSGVSINDIVAPMDAEFKAHFMGTHFFNPPRYMKLFEIIPAKETRPELVRWMANFSEKRLGKGVVIAKDTPNFIANRIGVQAMASVMTLSESYGYSIPKVDLLTGAIIGRPKTGTFRLADMVGIDILVHVAGNVLAKTDDSYEVSANTVPGYVHDMIEKGQLGDKTKGGFYKKERTSKGTQRLVWDFATKAYVPLERASNKAVSLAKKEATLAKRIHQMAWGQEEENRFVWEVLKSTLVYAANKVPEISDTCTAIDQAIKWGFNWEMGPFEVWDALGFKEASERMISEGDSLPDWIHQRLADGKKRFYEGDRQASSFIQLNHRDAFPVLKENKSAQLIDLNDGVLCLAFTSSGNTVDGAVIEMIHTAIETVEIKDYRGLVVGNQGKHFSPGANLMMVAELAMAKKWDQLEALVAGLQKSGMAIKYAKKPVVTCPHGMTLGGGAEIAMSGYQQVAHAETYMGLVELGVGLVPGGGGVKEMLLRHTPSISKPTLSERINLIKTAWETVAMAKVSSSAFDAREKGFLTEQDSIVMNSDHLLDRGKQAVIRLFEDGFRPLIPAEVVVTGTTGKGVLDNTIAFMIEGQFISEYDGYLAGRLAHIMTGGHVVPGSTVNEEWILELEREAFVSLCGETKTHQRIEHMLKKGKPLRN